MTGTNLHMFNKLSTHLFSRVFTYLVICISFASILQAKEASYQQSVPIRLTPEELGQNHESNCCPSQTTDSCEVPCCRGPSLNCPPIVPKCDPCDCIIDFYNPLVFNGWQLSGEWLFWTVTQQASSFAIDDLPVLPANALGNGWGEYTDSQFGWNSGLRINLGYTFERDAWHLGGQYTFFSTTGEKHISAPLLESTLTSNLNPIDHSKCSAHFNLNLLDFGLQRTFLPGCQILFDFFIGATSAFIKETLNIKYQSPLSNLSVKNRWGYSSGGLRASLNTHWHFGKGFGLFSKCSFAELIGSYQYHQKETANTAVVKDVKESLVTVVPSTQLGFGFDWNRRFCHWAINVLLGFEINTFYTLHQMRLNGFQLTPPEQGKIAYRDQSNVNLFGINLGANFSF